MEKNQAKSTSIPRFGILTEPSKKKTRTPPSGLKRPDAAARGKQPIP